MSSIFQILSQALKSVTGKCEEGESYLTSVDAVEMAEVAWEVLGPRSIQHCHTRSMPNFHLENIGVFPEKKKWTRDDFDFLKVLGWGAFGNVILAREISTSRLYAIKVLNKRNIVRNREIEHTLMENRVLRTNCNNPFLISLKCSFRTHESLFNVMEYACGGDLFYYRNKYGRFSEDDSRFYGAELTLAMGYLHQQGIVYRDLKLENIMIMEDGHLKLADFGFCKDGVFYGCVTNSFCGSPQYLPPEIILNEGHGLAVDWWSFGVIMYTLMCKNYPFIHDDESLLYSMILEHEPKIPGDLTREARDFLTGLLTKDPGDRLGGGRSDAEDVMKHPFFSSVNWLVVYDKKVEPPYKPKIGSDADTRYFDLGFTRMAVNLRTKDDGYIEGDEFFKDFSYQNNYDDF